MIGQTVINQEYGGRGRLSTFTAGTSMLIFVIAFNKLFVKVPVISLATVMVVVAITTFDWNSLRRLSKVPITDSIVMIITVVIVLITHNLAYGVVIGTLLSSVFFVAKASNIKSNKIIEGESVRYFVEGNLFFASTTSFIKCFDYNENIKKVEIDLSKVNIYDESAVDSIEKVRNRFLKNEIKVDLLGMNEKSKRLINNI